ncbi:sodium-coupled monocarboxylate transporter 1 [Plakobranchus ocellatus]|uniref:Sodium-coupled monocarboxylate transporter 1 n=1 Tax=Plakobranchus ocellatus TaxID=259542 RepID=A0AAV4C2T9_9GAST|nr:sodium-coupled monocarboxylate transporter 1 [Plakobranchus ocellatus]
MTLNLPVRWIITIMLFLIGLYMSTFFENCDPLKAKLVSARNEIVPLFMMDILSPTTGLAGLYLAGLFCATSSTVSAGLNSISAVVLEDYVKVYVKHHIRDNKARLYSQIIDHYVYIRNSFSARAERVHSRSALSTGKCKVLLLGILVYIKALLLSVVRNFTPKYNVPTERVLPPVPVWVPEAAPAPPETSLCIGPVDRTDETCPLALRPLFLDVIAKYGRQYALAYSDGSSAGGTGNRGNGIYIL